MKLYGYQQRSWSEDDDGPPSKYKVMTSKHRTKARRTAHKRGRRLAIKVIEEQLKDESKA